MADNFMNCEHNNRASTHRRDANVPVNPLRALLTSWKLKHLINFFEDLNITVPVLATMTANDIFNLTQQMKIGDKILFKYYLENGDTRTDCRQLVKTILANVK
ncbi:hypothetical protein CVS40_8234 [Lucilia cuprina]|nr:hypothetical protein CVS40_8234 [Lucilia cuprina]